MNKNKKDVISSLGQPKRPVLQIVAIAFVSIVPGASVYTTSQLTNVSPCLVSLPVPCIDELDQIRINYTERTYGFPATYKKTVTSERLKPEPYMSTTYTPVAFNPFTLFLNTGFWFLAINYVLRFIRNNK